MDYIVDSEKSLYEATVDLKAVILRLGFSLLHVHEPGAPGLGKACECDEDCTVFTVDSPRLSESLLAVDMRLALALPWRIAVYTESGNTRIGLLRPLSQLEALCPGVVATEAAREFDEKLLQMVDEAR